MAAGKVTGTNREVEAVVVASFAARTAASSFSRPLPYALALAPTAESSPAPENFFKNVLRQKGYPVLGQKPFLDRLLGEGHE